MSGKLLPRIKHPLKDLHVLSVSAVQPLRFGLGHCTASVERQDVTQVSDVVHLEIVFSQFGAVFMTFVFRRVEVP